MVTSHARLLSLSVYCAATLSSSDAFSLVQNAAASSQQSPERDGNGGGSSSSSNTRSSTAASAASSTTHKSHKGRDAVNPFRGTITGGKISTDRYHNHKHQNLARDDFALRMGVQAHLEHEESSHDDFDGSSSNVESLSASSHHDSLTSTTSSCSSDCNQPTTHSSSTSHEEMESQQQVHDRRKFLHGLVTSTAAFATSSATSSTDPSQPIPPANAFERTYPLELEYSPLDGETPFTSLSKLQEERISIKKAKIAQTQVELRTDPFGLSSSSTDNEIGTTIIGGMVWALALWFVSGSRSNPLVTPLANVLYKEEKETWLQDRNEGYFGEVPLELLMILASVFVFLGVVLDRAVYFLADGDSGVSLQLAGVSVVSGAVWEVGRLAVGEKDVTREEFEQDALLASEFAEFADKRIIVGRGNCHRSDVTKAFRRYNPKYRNAESEAYPLGDIEIERLLRTWNREQGGMEMSSAGFFSGIQINEQADAFAPR